MLYLAQVISWAYGIPTLFTYPVIAFSWNFSSVWAKQGRKYIKVYTNIACSGRKNCVPTSTILNMKNACVCFLFTRQCLLIPFFC